MEMTMDKQLSSEEKLLSIIRKKGPDDAVKAKNKKAADGRTKTPGRPLSLPLLNRFLVFAVIGGLALLGIKYFKQKDAVNLESIVNEKVKSKIADDRAAKADIQPFEFYSAEVLKKDLFQLPWEQNTDNIDVTQTSSSAVLQSLLLTGIVLDKDPKAVIEDPKSGQTYFLSVGDEINGAKVQKIEPDRVLFEYGGETIELKS
jgi:type II secretory pathway component PulC